MTTVVAVATVMWTPSFQSAAQDMKSIERELSRPSRERVIRDNRYAIRVNTDWRQEMRDFDRRVTTRTRDESRESSETTRRIRTELDTVSRNQQLRLDQQRRSVNQQSLQQRTQTLDSTRNEKQAGSVRLSERIRQDNQTRNDTRRERRQLVLDTIRNTVDDLRDKNKGSEKE